MAQEDTGALLRALNAVCGEGYQIIEEQELLGAAAPFVPAEPLELLLPRLHAEGYIDIQYAEGGIYCLRLLPRGRHYARDRARALVRARRSARRHAAVSFAASFFGALLGTLLPLALFLLLWGKGGMAA